MSFKKNILVLFYYVLVKERRRKICLDKKGMIDNTRTRKWIIYISLNNPFFRFLLMKGDISSTSFTEIMINV